MRSFFFLENRNALYKKMRLTAEPMAFGCVQYILSKNMESAV